MRKDLATRLSGLAAIMLDYVIAASNVGMVLLARSIGVGSTSDVLTVLLASHGNVASFYGKRFTQFLSRKMVKIQIRSHARILTDACHSKAPGPEDRILAEPLS